MTQLRARRGAAEAQPAERDDVDGFLTRLGGLEIDLEVEGIVERISKLNKRFRSELERTLAEHGLTLPEWQVLGCLRLECGCDTPGMIAAELDLSSGAMTHRLDRLEQAGLVRRRPDPADRRGVRIELTDAGRKAWTESVNAQARKESLVASALTPDEQRQLNDLLRKLMLSFGRDGREGS